jgi:hypothetical protein
MSILNEKAMENEFDFQRMMMDWSLSTFNHLLLNKNHKVFEIQRKDLHILLKFPLLNLQNVLLKLSADPQTVKY